MSPLGETVRRREGRVELHAATATPFQFPLISDRQGVRGPPGWPETMQVPTG